MIKYLTLAFLFQSAYASAPVLVKNKETIVQKFIRIAKEEKVNAKLLTSICWVETNHRMFERSIEDGNSDSYGICQVKIDTAKFLGFKGTYTTLWKNVDINIKYAARYLNWQMLRYNNSIQKAVVSYNSGSYIKTNTKYYKKVMKAYKDQPWK